MLAQNGLYAAVFNEQRCEASSIVYDAGNHIFGWNGKPFQLAELKTAEENRFQPIHKRTRPKGLPASSESLTVLPVRSSLSSYHASLLDTRKMRLLIKIMP